MLALILTAAVQAAASADADPLALARKGMQQCYAPNLSAKTCQSLAGYVFEADGTIINTAEVLIASSPVVTLKTAEPVIVKSGAVCGQLSDFHDAEVFVGGKTADPAVSAKVREQLLAAMAPILGKEICTYYLQGNGAMSASATLDGQPAPAMTTTVLWIAPTDGYSVRP
ncbi:hypothetical protein [Caulobacter sp. DWP3-1-3b2]|uniref:hypothetical protein n=1 Tax=Caulobacter sp. DWP3-1-3b2 TaxID=2804643 RepID=UPI003CE74380